MGIGPGAAHALRGCVPEQGRHPLGGCLWSSSERADWGSLFRMVLSGGSKPHAAFEVIIMSSILCQRVWSALSLLVVCCKVSSAQGFAALDAAAPPALPVPALWERYLYEQPMLLSVLVVGIGVIVGLGLQMRGKRNAAVGVLVGAVAAAGAVFGTASAVTTAREELMEHARRLIGATALGEASSVEAMLTSDAVLYLPHFSGPERVDQIVTRVRSDLARGGAYEVREHRIREIQATADAPQRGRVQVKVIVTLQSTGYPIPSWWRLDLERARAGEWRTSGISLLSIGGGLSR